MIIYRYNFFDKLDGLHGRYVHFGRPGLAADGDDVPGEVDHEVAGGDGAHVGHVTATNYTEAKSRTVATPTTSTGARSQVKIGRMVDDWRGKAARPDGETLELVA